MGQAGNVVVQPVENRLFDSFFLDVSRCLDIMRDTASVAFGSAVLRGLESNPEWDCKQMLFCVDCCPPFGDGLAVWHDFLLGQKYSLAQNAQVDFPGGVKVCSFFGQSEAMEKFLICIVYTIC